MSIFRWYPMTTSKTRYVGDLRSERKNCGASSDIFELVQEYASSRQKKSLRILDVGCSTGVAAAYMKNKLLDVGLEANINGVDPAPEVFERARQNLDKFYEGRMEDVEIEEHYDIVLCARLLRFAFPGEQKNLMEKCADCCVPDGSLIVDGVLKTMKNEYHSVSKNRAPDYVRSLMHSWDSLSRWERWCLKMRLRRRRFRAMAWYEARCRLARAFRSHFKAAARGGCSRMPDGVAGAGWLHCLAPGFTAGCSRGPPPRAGSCTPRQVNTMQRKAGGRP